MTTIHGDLPKHKVELKPAKLIHIHATLAEANKYVAGVWKKAHAPAELLRWDERWHTWRRGGG
ncbi:MAG TPA: hypothetical protein PK440_22090 [Candidatus Accumulibacter phosphatis]|nr:MAG: hypothetical protein AW07_03608 [Candidatus Accumulibacter sp. SK-11]HAY26810.1 hypothetical protein [Accumulibacter sp.]HCN69769.1 hypothetical protein [Accumulibacter sp.]HRL77762.1 hypothetical protein [Candidatus Accumulibacter phosphatis]HRQ97642.1 hypothetical protein [Candidatus Accumulibacter phosphatis]